MSEVFGIFLAKVLIVDDEPDIALLLKKGLERNRLQVDAFTDPLDALDKFKAGEYLVAVLDIRMPKLTGFQLYRKLREKDDKLKVCFMTAFDVYEKEFKMMFPDITPSAFVKKPVLPSQLVKVVNMCVEAK